MYYIIIYSLQQIDSYTYIHRRTPKDAKHNDYNRVNNINMCSCFFLVYKNRSNIIRVLALVF